MVFSITPPAAVALPDVPREAVPFLIYKPITVPEGILIGKTPIKAELRRQKRKGIQNHKDFFVENAKIKVLTTDVFVRYNKLNNKKPFFYFALRRREVSSTRSGNNHSVSTVGSWKRLTASAVDGVIFRPLRKTVFHIPLSAGHIPLTGAC